MQYALPRHKARAQLILSYAPQRIHLVPKYWGERQLQTMWSVPDVNHVSGTYREIVACPARLERATYALEGRNFKKLKSLLLTELRLAYP